jgi:hypothetical protein
MLLMALQKEAFAASRHLPEKYPAFPRIRCSKPLDLQIDLSADDNGKAVHEESKRFTISLSNPAALIAA